MKEPIETSELLAFAKTVDARSLSRAAAELGVPRATISRRLARLEERLGTRLLRRSSRSVVVRDGGEELYGEGGIVVEGVDSGEAGVGGRGEGMWGGVGVS